MDEERYLTERGRQAARQMFGDGGDDFMERHNQEWAERVDADWARIMTQFLMEGLYSRDVLPTSTRELCAVAALTVLGRTEELEAHLRIALSVNPPEQVREVVLQMSVYGGMPVALHALRMYDGLVAGGDGGVPPTGA
ncbi:MAG TPA: carboxymuconolactone decarboxylase family protein [Acidimicrobiales bacterium]